jgi:hypothetical protein
VACRAFAVKRPSWKITALARADESSETATPLLAQPVVAALRQFGSDRSRSGLVANGLDPSKLTRSRRLRLLESIKICEVQADENG